MNCSYTLIRQKARHYDASRRSDQIFMIRRDLNRLTLVAQMAQDSLPANPEEVLKALSVPADYQKIIDYIGICPPKIRRLAIRCLEMWNRMDSGEYMGTLRNSFFDETGRLKPGDTGMLFAEFYSRLLEKRHGTKRSNPQDFEEKQSGSGN